MNEFMNDYNVMSRSASVSAAAGTAHFSDVLPVELTQVGIMGKFIKSMWWKPAAVNLRCSMRTSPQE